MKKLKRINLFLFIYDSNEKVKWRAKIIFLSRKSYPGLKKQLRNYYIRAFFM